LAQRNGDFHVFNGQFWERIQPESFHTFLRNATLRFGVPKDLSRFFKFQDKIRDQFRDIANFPFVQDDKITRINLKSGTLEFKDSQEPQLMPFDKRHGLCYQLGYDLDPDADCPIYRAFMDRCVPDVANQLIIEEYAAYIFVNRFNFEKVLFLYGSGANGKSVLLAILKALLGTSNVTEYSLANITKKQEYRAKLAEGLLNVCAESANTLDIDVFKKIASREPLECRRLYENPITLTNYSRQIFATNVLPKTTEATEGFFRRFLIIPFTEFIPPTERNYRMNTVEFWEESGELPGILNMVIKGLQRLIRNGGFTESKSADTIHDEYRQNSNSVQLFMQDEGYQPDTAEQILLPELHSLYKDYCRENGYIAVSSQTMAERLRNIGYHVAKGSRNKTYVFTVKAITI
jgi:putative DNA primase/helicase